MRNVGANNHRRGIVGLLVTGWIASSACVTYADQPNPVQSFEALIQTRAAASMTPYVFQAPNKSYRKAFGSIEGLKYDVRKTDSLVTPVVGTVTFTFRSKPSEAFDTESGAHEATQPAAGGHENVNEVSITYGLRDGSWTFASGTRLVSLNPPIGRADKTRIQIDAEKKDRQPDWLRRWIP